MSEVSIFLYILIMAGLAFYFLVSSVKILHLQKQGKEFQPAGRSRRMYMSARLLANDELSRSGSDGRAEILVGRAISAGTFSPEEKDSLVELLGEHLWTEEAVRRAGNQIKSERPEEVMGAVPFRFGRPFPRPCFLVATDPCA